MNREVIKLPFREISVWLEDDHDNELQKFRCVRCGRIVFEYYGNVDMIVNGTHRGKKPTVVFCHSRKEIWKEGLELERIEACNTKYYVE